MVKFIIGFVVFSLSAPAFASEAQHVSVTVEGANDDYTPTGLSVKPGDLVLVGATGKVALGAWAGSTDPNGKGGPCHGFDTDGALIFKIGATAAERAGKRKVILADAAGELKLKVRDTRYSDNSGAYAVDVVLLPKNMQPPEPIRVDVDVANDEWTPSDLKVEIGDLLLIAAKADTAGVKFKNAHPRAKGPDGVQCSGTVSVRSENDGALMMKIGTSQYRRAGAMNFMVSDGAGPVKFRARLEKPAGNSGTYKVAVWKFPKGSIPLTESVEADE